MISVTQFLSVLPVKPFVHVEAVTNGLVGQTILEKNFLLEDNRELVNPDPGLVRGNHCSLQIGVLWPAKKYYILCRKLSGLYVIHFYDYC